MYINTENNEDVESMYDEAPIENGDTHYRDVAPYPQTSDNYENTLSQYELNRYKLGLPINQTPLKSDI